MKSIASDALEASAGTSKSAAIHGYSGFTLPAPALCHQGAALKR